MLLQKKQTASGGGESRNKCTTSPQAARQNGNSELTVATPVQVTAIPPKHLSLSLSYFGGGQMIVCIHVHIGASARIYFRVRLRNSEHH